MRGLVGVILACISFTSYTTMDLFAQYLQVTSDIDARSLTLFRGIGTLIIMYIYLYTFKRGVEPHIPLGPKEHRPMLLLYSALSGIGCLAFYTAIQHLPMSDTMTILQLRPFVTGFVSSWTLGESLTPVQLIASVISVLGELLIVKPDFLFSSSFSDPASHIDSGPGSVAASTPMERLISSGILMILVCTASFNFTIMRSFKGAISPGLLLAFESIGTTTVAGLSLAVQGQWPVLPFTLYEWALVAAVLISGIIAQTLLALSILYESAITIAIIGQFQVIPGAFLDLIVYGSHLDLLGGVGAVITTSSSIWAITGRPVEKPDEKTYRPPDEETPLLQDH